MEDRLLDYYERELTFIREMGSEFARKYPKIAGRLLLEADKCEDPHTERLIEAFAFLCGRIHKKIDDDFPEITESLLNILYPHYVNPIPSMTVVRFEPVKQNIGETGFSLPRETKIYSKPVGGIPCQFRTCYPLTLWPVEVTGAKLNDVNGGPACAQQVIEINLQTFNKLTFDQINWENLRFFLNGPAQHVYHLYELLFNNVCHVECVTVSAKGGKEAIPLSPADIEPVGFSADEHLLPYSKRSFPGYLLLFEYFCFPEKFLYFDLQGLKRLRQHNLGDSLTLRIFLDRPAKTNLVVNKDTFCLNTVPAINLFQRSAEPIRIEQRRTEYRVVPDIRRQDGIEVYSIDSVTASRANQPGAVFEYKPFYSVRHYLEEESPSGQRVFWHAQRRPSGKKGDDGTEMYLSFSDLDFDPADPGTEVLTVHTTCTNRDLPGRLPFGDMRGDFDLETAAPVSRINSLIKPSVTRRPAMGGGLQWRLISHLSLNYMSLVEGGEEALKEILRLYDFDNSPATRQQIEGVVALQAQYVTRRIGRSFCRGVQIHLTLDEDKFIGSGLFLFASVLERFIGQYVSVNSFSQLVAKTLQRKEALKHWRPRNGNQILL